MSTFLRTGLVGCGLFFACSLSLGGRDRCRDASDCVAGRVCESGICTTATVDGAATDSDGGAVDGAVPPRADWTSHSQAIATLGGALRLPSAVCWSGSQLYVSDLGHHRVLIYPSIEDGQAPTEVVGQPDLVTPEENGAGGLAVPLPASQRTLNRPRGLWCSETYLMVADSYNHRVLVFEHPTTYSAASGVCGQADFAQQAINRNHAVDARGLSVPYDVAWDGARLFIADFGNNRVVAYSATAQNLANLHNTDAEIVFGKPGFTATEVGLIADPSGLNGPTGVTVDGTRLAIADSVNNRVLVFDVPASYQPETWLEANAVIGQADLHTGVPSTEGLSSPGAVRALGTQTFVADRHNNRVLVYDGRLPRANQQLAQLAAIGQPNLATSTADSLNQPGGMAVVYKRGEMYLVVVDTENHQVKVFQP